MKTGSYAALRAVDLDWIIGRSLVSYCSVCELRSRQLKALTRECMMPLQKYTSSQHGNKCLKEEIRSVTKVVFVGKDKAGLVRKDTT